MDYIDVLNEQKEYLEIGQKWWPEYLYHFTDVHNVPSILQEGYIFSRERADEKHIMVNDNASGAVISGTAPDNKKYARLYFRPLTPTQYNNEGYKPPELRNEQINASCPVPVFLCFDANATLNYPGTMFAEQGISGQRNNIEAGVEAFQKLNFQKIYHDGPYDTDTESDIKNYRHSEVVRKQEFPVKPLLRGIVCRTEAERETLLFLLKQRSSALYDSYKEKIICNPKYKFFYCNGIFIKKLTIQDNTLCVIFNDPGDRRVKGFEQPIMMKSTVIVYLKKSNEKILKKLEGSADVCYNEDSGRKLTLPAELKFDSAYVKIKFNEADMYENELSCESEIVF